MKEINNKKSLQKKQLISKAIQLHKDGNISEAINYYQFCINEGFNSPEVFSNYGLILKSLGKLNEAEIVIKEAIRIQPNKANSHSILASISRSLGKLNEAEISTRKAIQFDPNNANLHSNLGSILRELGKLNEAEICTRKAIQLNPDFANAHSNLGIILKDLRKLKEACLLYTSDAADE